MDVGSKQQTWRGLSRWLFSSQYFVRLDHNNYLLEFYAYALTIVICFLWVPAVRIQEVNSRRDK